MSQLLSMWRPASEVRSAKPMMWVVVSTPEVESMSVIKKKVLRFVAVTCRPRKSVAVSV